MLDKIAEIQHQIWAHWMKYLFEVSIQNEDGSVTIPAAKVTRWRRQMATEYQNLSDTEKASDIEQAERILVAIKNEH